MSQLVVDFYWSAGPLLRPATGCRQLPVQQRPAGYVGRRNKFMDYVIAGIASLALFIYLIYALLRPEKF